MFTYFWERERETEHEWGRVRETETESEAGSRLELWVVGTAQSMGLELPSSEIMTWDEVGLLTDWTTQVPWY